MYRSGSCASFDNVYVEAISKSNALMKFDRNCKRLRGSYTKLYGIKCIILAFGGI